MSDYYLYGKEKVPKETFAPDIQNCSVMRLHDRLYSNTLTVRNFSIHEEPKLQQRFLKNIHYTMPHLQSHLFIVSHPPPQQTHPPLDVVWTEQRSELESALDSKENFCHSKCLRKFPELKFECKIVSLFVCRNVMLQTCFTVQNAVWFKPTRNGC